MNNGIENVMNRIEEIEQEQRELQETEIMLQRMTLDILCNLRMIVQTMKSLGLTDDEIKAKNPEILQLPEKTIAFLFSE